MKIRLFNIISWEEFSKEFGKVSELVEQRRKRHLEFLYLDMAVLILLLIFIFSYPSIYTSKTALGEAGYIGLFILGSVAWILLPIYHYRGMNSTAALKPSLYQRFSLKDDVYSKIFKLFGNVEFAPHGGVSLIEIRKSTLFPEHTLYITEDYVVGQLNNMEAKLCEADIARVINKKRVSAFKGLLLVCDISDIKIKLRSGFRGRTAVINDEQKNIAAIVKRYSEMKRFPLPEKFEPLFEGYTTDVSEAQAVITNEFLESLAAFAEQAKQLKLQEEHWDDKLAYAVSAIYDFCKDKLIFATGKSELPSEKAYDQMYDTDLDITKADPISNDVNSLNRQAEIEFYEDKFIITIPCKFDLFELGSVFEPALNDEDARFLYSMMQFLDKVTLHLSQVEP